MDQIGVVAGIISTSLFVLSYLPMLVKAVRTKDLSSYSPGYLVVANVGNFIHSVYVASLPFGPIWFLHIFYTATSALMLCWYVRYHSHHARASTAIITPRPPPAPAAQPTANGPPRPCADWGPYGFQEPAAGRALPGVWLPVLLHPTDRPSVIALPWSTARTRSRRRSRWFAGASGSARPNDPQVGCNETCVARSRRKLRSSRGENWADDSCSATVRPRTSAMTVTTVLLTVIQRPGIVRGPWKANRSATEPGEE